jgi:hypothetical protein
MTAEHLWHPYLRLTRLLRALIGTGWGDQWPAAKVALQRVMVERARARRAGWFN